MKDSHEIQMQEDPLIGRGVWSSLKRHWPEYLMEAVELGFLAFMSCAASALYYYRDSPLVGFFDGHELLRRLAVGLTLGLTVAGIIYSPLGRRSGAHINPAVTFTFFRLGKIYAADAFFYILFQFVGGIAGVVFAGVVLGSIASAPEVNFASTKPGDYGVGVAFLAELVISAVIMGAVLYVTNRKQIMHRTGLVVGILYASYFTFEQPLSGTSMNPARALGSAVITGSWTGLWVYFTAPLLGMLLAGEAFLWTKGRDAIHCAKLYHTANVRCIFKCGWGGMMEEESD